ncbi:GNAT family N-acetyltransferase [Streptomyces sp. 4F14]|uniref:GNAT family N-acetyltransferase n=1 Tax=Streptomyces sp. 4F14 TaxID=3394380 RepID=UPI003A882D22
MSSIPVTTWSLELSAPTDLLPASAPEGDVRVARAAVPSPEFSRFLYASVGGDIRWIDRLHWSHDLWREYLERPGVETWVAYERDTPAGYVELEPQADGAVEIVYFGLLPAFRGRRIGGHLLSYGAARAWDLAGRWPQLAPTKRVWLHTCSLDGEHALANYQRRGFRLYDTEVREQTEVPAPGPWPGAYPA